MSKSQAVATPSLLEAKQESVRTTIGEHALRLFAERGYEASTVDDIARAAGIGRRTFFRYFDGKDAVVLWRFDQFARRAVALLRARPSREPGLTAMERALTEASEFYNQDPEQSLRILKLTEATRSLLAQQLLQQDRWKTWFAEVLRERGKHVEGSLQSDITAAVALEAMALAVRRWVDAPELGLSALIARCFAALRKGVR
ncbi:MAG TPA: TetR family transcriptional regulator [Polyangiales bacterium]|nr:TetR family transcriptional regulator [Polyangiales bacterium]